jgi:transposase
VKYVGMDVHSRSTVWCLLDASGALEREGSVETTGAALVALVKELSGEGVILAGQEVGTMSYLVHDTLSAAGTKILSFNAAQLRMIAASRKKTDRRDAFWIAKALASGMYPHPVYIPTGEIRELRALLVRRRMVQAERNRWQYRARAALRASGRRLRTGGHYLRRALKGCLEGTSDLDASLRETLALCMRQEASLATELRRVESELRRTTRTIDAITRLKTIPAVGDLVATTIYAWVGEIGRFPDAKSLAAYAGLVPAVYQSAATRRSGTITKQGSKALRSALVQSAHVLASRCRTAEARPLQAIGARVRTSRGRRKIATVALARHLLRIAYYVLRDGTTYDPKRLREGRERTSEAA